MRRFSLYRKKKRDAVDGSSSWEEKTNKTQHEYNKKK